MCKYFTPGRNKRTGDRSYCEDVVKVLEENETHWLVEFVYTDFSLRQNVTKIMMKDEYDITPDDHIATCLKRLNKLEDRCNCCCCKSN